MNIGEINLLIGKIRRSRNIRQETLCRGICSVQQISKIEKGEVTPDFFLSEILMQRLGKTLDKLEIILPLEEYEEIEERDNIIDDLRQGRLEEAERRLEEFSSRVAGKRPMREMNYHRLQGMLAYEKGDHAAAKEQLHLAAQLSIVGAEGIRHIDFSNRLLAEIELETLILYARMQRDTQERGEAEELLEAVLGYVREKITDEEELVKFKPKIAAVLGEIYCSAGKYDACIRICEEALELLRDQGMMQCMTRLIGLLLEAYDRTGRQERGKKPAAWKETLEQMYAHFGLDVEMVNKLYFNCCAGQYYLIGEVVRDERKARGISQEELIDGIYQNPENLSRIENGRNPDDKKLKMLFGRLGIERYRYTGKVITNEYALLELVAEINALWSRKEFNKAKWELERLKKQLDMHIPENRQLVENMEICQKRKEGCIAAEEALRQTNDLLRLTYNMKGERIPFENEALLLNQICNCMICMEQYDETIALQKKTIALFINSRVNLRYRFRIINLLIYNMSRIMEHMTYLEEAEYWSELGITMLLLNSKGALLPKLLGNLIGIKENNQKDVSATYVKWAYHLTDIFKQYNDQEYLKRYNQEYFDGTIFWY